MCAERLAYKGGEACPRLGSERRVHEVPRVYAERWGNTGAAELRAC